jgi:hypothetical protein
MKICCFEGVFRYEVSAHGLGMITCFSKRDNGYAHGLGPVAMPVIPNDDSRPCFLLNKLGSALVRGNDIQN